MALQNLLTLVTMWSGIDMRNDVMLRDLVSVADAISAPAKCIRAVLSPRWIPTQMHTSRPITTMDCYRNAHEPSYHHDGILPKCIRAVLSPRWIPTQMHKSRPIITMDSYPNAHEPSYHHDGFLPKCTRAVRSPRWIPTQMHKSRPIITMESYPNA